MDSLSHKHQTGNRDQEIVGMRENVNAISTLMSIPVCMSIEDIQTPTCWDAHLQELMVYIIQGWPHKKEEVNQSIRQYRPIRNELAIIDRKNTVKQCAIYLDYQQTQPYETSNNVGPSKQAVGNGWCRYIFNN